MLFSALYSMLPSAKSSLIDGGFTPKHAAWTLIACFLGGVIGIQVISRIMHHFIPSHVVDCEHTHEEPVKENGHAHEDDHEHEHDHEAARPQPPRRSSLPGHFVQVSSHPDQAQRCDNFVYVVNPAHLCNTCQLMCVRAGRGESTPLGNHLSLVAQL